MYIRIVHTSDFFVLAYPVIQAEDKLKSQGIRDWSLFMTRGSGFK